MRRPRDAWEKDDVSAGGEECTREDSKGRGVRVSAVLDLGLCVGAHTADQPPTRKTTGPVAQLAEQQTLNLRVEGSIPSWLTTFPNQIQKFLLASS